MTAPDGYTPHDGGPMPVAGDVTVDAVFRFGKIDFSFPAIRLSWFHDGRGDDIIAWKPAP